MSKVSVILLCYNQAQYVEQAIRSVWYQDHNDIELIVVDDGSEDNSREVIRSLRLEGEFQYLENPTNLGNCASFNKGFAASTGNYIIDLAADDYFLPGKVSKQLERFNDLGDDYGVVFTDAELVDEVGHSLGTHMERVFKIGKVKSIPEGFIFAELLEYFFISAATQMIRREVLERMGGYDDSLAYEDFDFWIRSAKDWKYSYLDEALMVLRKLPTGMSSNMYGPTDPKVASTLMVTKKAYQLVSNQREKRALLRRIKYELRMAYKYGNKEYLKEWYELYRECGGKNPVYWILKSIG